MSTFLAIVGGTALAGFAIVAFIFVALAVLMSIYWKDG